MERAARVEYLNMHNSPEKNKAFQEAWDATNARYIASTKWAISETFKRRHESKTVRNACRGNIAFYRKCQKLGKI